MANSQAISRDQLVPKYYVHELITPNKTIVRSLENESLPALKDSVQQLCGGDARFDNIEGQPNDLFIFHQGFNQGNTPAGVIGKTTVTKSMTNAAQADWRQKQAA